MWGQRRLNYLKHHRKVLYYNLLTSGKLPAILVNTCETQAQNLVARLLNYTTFETTFQFNELKAKENILLCD